MSYLWWSFGSWRRMFVWRVRYPWRLAVLRAVGYQRRLPGIADAEEQFLSVAAEHRSCCCGAVWVPGKRVWVSIIACGGPAPRGWDEPLEAYLRREGFRP